MKHNLIYPLLCLLAVSLTTLMVERSYGRQINNDTAVFVGLDKITGSISEFSVKIGESGKLGALAIVPRACYSRSGDELQNMAAFVEIYQHKVENGKITNEGEKIFSGWFFASSPGLSALDNPVYDVWLVDCQ